MQRRIQNLAKYLRWSFLLQLVNKWKPLTILAKILILDIWQGSENASAMRFVTICIF